MLTDIQIKNAKPKDKPYKLADREGMYIYITPKGKKVFRLKYRINGKEGVYVIGHYPQIKLTEARREALEVKKQIAQGINPLQAKRQQKAQVSKRTVFWHVAGEWLEHKKQNISKKRGEKLGLIVKQYLNPYIGDRDVTEIKGEDVLNMAKALERRGSIKTGEPLKTMVTLAVQSVGQILKHARVMGLTDYIIDTGAIKRLLITHTTKNHPHVGIIEIPRLLQDIEVFRIADTNRIAIKLLMLLVTRQSALRFSKWEDLDYTSQVLTIKSENQKGSKLQKQDGSLTHKVPLSSQAMHLLNQLREATNAKDGDYIIPSAKGNHTPVSDSTLSKAFRENGYRGRQDIHGLRGLFSTWANETYPEKYNTIEAILSHKVGNKITQAYNHASYMNSKRELLQLWGDYLENQGLKITI